METSVPFRKTCSRFACLTAWLLAANIVIAQNPALAETRTHVFGSLAMDLDDLEWQVERDSFSRWTLKSVNPEKPGAVAVTVVDENSAITCTELANKHFPEMFFRQPKESAALVAGLPAIQVLDYPGCKSLSQLHQSFCVSYESKTYLFTHLPKSCGYFKRPFSSEEAYAQFLATIKIAPVSGSTP